MEKVGVCDGGLNDLSSGMGGHVGWYCLVGNYQIGNGVDRLDIHFYLVPTYLYNNLSAGFTFIYLMGMVEDALVVSDGQSGFIKQYISRTNHHGQL